MSKSLDVNEGLVSQLVVYLRKWHAVERNTGQNDGSNDTDDMHDELEMHEDGVDRADLEGLYAGLNVSQKTDISALVLIGMDEERSLEAARSRIAREEPIGLDDLLEMPLAPEYLSSGLSQLAGGESDNVVRLTTPERRR